jgi:predicted HNH restriction endonuclease
MKESEITITERNDLVPKCPHCEKALNEVYVQKKGVGVILARSSVFFCPNCHKVLGFGESRMM